MDKLAQAARELLSAGESAHEPAALAERATRALDELAAHLSRIVGRDGVLAVLDRSIVLASAELPWLAEAKRAATHRSSESVYAALSSAMGAQPPEVVIESFVAVLSKFIGLLGNLIGESLVWRLVEEVWPTIFPFDVKETS
jgi:hypothetical protein